MLDQATDRSIERIRAAVFDGLLELRQGQEKIVEESLNRFEKITGRMNRTISDAHETFQKLESQQLKKIELNVTKGDVEHQRKLEEIRLSFAKEKDTLLLKLRNDLIDPIKQRIDDAVQSTINEMEGSVDRIVSKKKSSQMLGEFALGVVSTMVGFSALFALAKFAGLL